MNRFAHWLCDMSRLTGMLVTMALLLAGAPSARAATFVFTQTGPGSDTNWFNPINWAPQGVPGPTDTAVFNTSLAGSSSSLICDIAQAVTVANLSVSGFTQITQNGLTVTGTFNFAGGALAGAGPITIPLGAIANLTGSTTDNSKLISGPTFNNQGTVNLFSNGPLFLQNGSVFNNSGAFNLMDDNGTGVGQVVPPPIFNNLPGGTITKVAGSGLSDFRFTLNNAGTINAQTGTIGIFGGTGNGSVSSGIFNAALGATINFEGATQTLTNGATITGAGYTTVNGGGAIANIPAGATVTAHNFGLISGAIAGQGTLNVTGDLTWLGGNLNGDSTAALPNGVTNVASGATFTVGGSNNKILTGRTLNNFGDGTWTDVGAIAIGVGGVFNNGGSFSAISDARVIGAGSPTGRINNLAGATFGKAQSTGVTDVVVPFNNDGHTVVQTGTLSFLGGTGAGTFSTAAGALTKFRGGTYTLTNGAAIDGDGFASIDGGPGGGGAELKIAAGAVVTARNISLISGALQGAGTLNVSGTFNWTGDTMDGDETLASPNGITNLLPGGALNLSGSDNKFLARRTLNNQGTVNWAGTAGIFASNGAVVNNSGFFSIQTDHNFQQSSVATFNNQQGGLLTKAAGTGTTAFNLAFNNAGTVNLRTGTTAFSNYKQTAGVTSLNGGNLSSTNNPLNFQGGTLNGTGTITGGVINGGTISPGHSPGVLTINGDYTQAATGLLTLEVGGRTIGTQTDRLSISGTATLAGTLNVPLLNGFQPLATDRFALISYGSHTGTFDTVAGPFTATYGTTQMVLVPNPDAPVITSFTPASGVPGATVTISGRNLSSGGVFFNGKAAAVSAAQSTATRIVATVPSGATSGPPRVTTTRGSFITAAPFTVLALVRSLISGTVTRPATATAPAAPLANVPVFLVNATSLPALAAVAANPALLAGSGSLITRTVTSATGAYSFSTLPGAYVVVPVAPGSTFNPLLRTVAVVNAAVPNQNFALAGLDAVPPVVTITTATPTTVTGTATDAGTTASGVFTILVTLQNSHGQFLNWTVATPQFTAAPVVGSFKLATPPGSVTPITNVGKVLTQNWAVLLPAVLPAGSYIVTVRAIDRAFKVSAPIVKSITKPAVAPRSVGLSTADASAATGCVTLRFGSALDAESAGDAGHYTVTVDGRAVTVQSAGYEDQTHTTTLMLPGGALRAGAQVGVTWSGLLDALSRPLAGGNASLTAR